MPDIIKQMFVEGQSFDEAIAFIRQKINMPAEHWDDLWKIMHTKGFMIAGAMQEELLEDMRSAVDKAIAEGTSLRDFRKSFDGIVEKYGWAYKGGRNWRTKVIFDTNIRTAYQAGRYKQMTDPAVVEARPFWEYRHSGSINPRQEHLGWDGLVLPHDDPWWDTHYPPNGWGCNCKVVSLSNRDMQKLGKKKANKTPKIEYREWTDGKGKTHQVPKGIDPGWDYNVGQGDNILT